jgi:hypothetical protein
MTYFGCKIHDQDRNVLYQICSTCAVNFRVWLNEEQYTVLFTVPCGLKGAERQDLLSAAFALLVLPV